MLARMRADLRDFTLYTPGDGDDSMVRLHANELPFRATDDQTTRGRHRYPLGRHGALTERLAQMYGVTPGQVLATRGSDDGIDLLIRTFCAAGTDTIVCTTPGFGMYRALARLQGCASLEYPLHDADDFALDIRRYVASATPDTKMLFVCSPNNPSGRAVPTDDIAFACRELAGRALVVVDEAYAEFCTAPSAATLLNEFDNLIVLRTLSKAYGLASARVGAVLGNAEVIAVLDRLLTPFPLPTASVVDAMQRTDPAQHAALRRQWQDLMEQREALVQALRALPCIEKVWPSDANFVLTRTREPAALVHSARAQGLLIRLIQGVDRAFVRITVGTPQQNLQLLAALEAFKP